MQSLIRSKSAGVTGGRGKAGAGPGRDLLYQLSSPGALHVVLGTKGLLGITAGVSIGRLLRPPRVFVSPATR